MPKIEVDIPQCQYDLLKDIAKKVGISTEKLLMQEVASAVDNACAWAERGSLL
jgi:hypothetical protein